MTDRLLSGQKLGPGGTLKSKNGVYTFVLQTVGNLVLYRDIVRADAAIWESAPGIGCVSFAMQADGNLVGYNASGDAVWATNTAGNPGAYFTVQDDGNAVVYSASGQALWATNTAGGRRPEKSTGVFSKIAGTLGGAASGLAHGVASAAQVTGKAFTDVTTSSAWKLIATGVGTVGNLALPGIATGISAAMLTASKIGQAASSKDGIIAAARELIPGDAAKTGFDIGTGVAIHGAGMTGDALKAAREKLPAGPARAGFDSALTLHVGRITAKQPAPAHLSPPARAAYYVSKGLVKVGAPRNMRKAVVNTVATSAVARQGVHAAITPRAVEPEMSYLEWAWRKIHATVTGSQPGGHVAIRGEYPQ